MIRRLSKRERFRRLLKHLNDKMNSYGILRYPNSHMNCQTGHVRLAIPIKEKKMKKNLLMNLKTFDHR